MRISGQSGCEGSTPPTMSCERESLLTNSARCPTLIVRSSGCMPLAVIVIVVDGGEGVGDGDGDGLLTGGVGVVGVDDVPPEQAAHITIAMSTRARISVRPGRDRRSYLTLTLSQCRNWIN